ncbi:MAG: hypothetical protein GY943_30205 [Chloroflexi bacterium]|nr:hypothetical protein [Chloroflexota bacterium]
MNKRPFPTYQITVKGTLDESWSDWFDQLTITQSSNGTTILTGGIADQSRLLAILTRLHSMNLTLLALETNLES